MGYIRYIEQREPAAMNTTTALQTLTGYHLTTKDVWAKIREYDQLLGSAWTDDMVALQSMNSNPFNLRRDGAVWCFPTLEAARANQEDGEVILRIEGQGLVVEHNDHGTCHVLKANTSDAALVRKNAKR